MATEKPKSASAHAQTTHPKCGIIMPISDTPDLGYPLGHWSQVLDVIKTAASLAGFEADMVSNDAQVEIIHATIIKNIYANDVAVCDVSTRNPNVMFELGLRIASKKPIILIKDDATPFSFDTQLIPHLPYRRDLRMHETLAFQKQLSDKIKQVHEESQQPGYKSFLEQFTSYTLAQVDEQQVGIPEYLSQIADRMQGLEGTVKQLSSKLPRTGASSYSSSGQQRIFIPFQDNRLDIPEIKNYIASKAEALDYKAPLLPSEVSRLRQAFASRFSSFASKTTPEDLEALIKEVGDEALFEVGKIK